MLINMIAAAVLVLVVRSATNSTAICLQKYELGEIFDITHAYTPEMPKFDSPDGIGTVVPSYRGINSSENRHLNWAPISIATNAGTHTRAYDRVEKLDLEILNGPVLVVKVPNDANVTADVLEFLDIPMEVERVLFKTSNSDRGLMNKREFDSSYTGLTMSGAEWLSRNTNIKLVGLDYLSVAVMQDMESVYQLFGEDIIPVEGLKLDEINPGEYTLSCLPLPVSDATEAPTRCILIQ